MKALRDDQHDGIGKLRDALMCGRKRVVMQAATGWGKTLVAASIIERALEKDRRVLMTVPALSLVDQTVEVLYEQGIEDVGVIQGNHHMTDWGKPVQVASVQTLARRELPKADIKLIDECHLMFKLYDELLLGEEQRKIPSIGLSATPWSKGLGKWYEELIVVATTADLIAKGFLSPFRTFAPSHPDLKGVRIVAGDYHEGELAERMSKTKLVADIVETWKAKADGRPTICFAVNRAHARMLCDRFTEAGVTAGYMDCDTGLDERRDIARRFADGEIQVACNVDVIGVGVDWPSISCVIYARPTKSEMRFVQNIGRALRVAPGKVDTLILDHSDTTLRLGFVTDIAHEELDDGKRKEAAPPSPALPKECTACGYLKPPRTPGCPNCGHTMQAHANIDVAPGELAELTARKKNKSADKFPNRRNTYGQLLWYAASKGHIMVSAANKFRELYGVWPRGLDDAPRYAPTPELMSWIRSTQIRWAKSKRNPAEQAADRKARDEEIIAKVREQYAPQPVLPLVPGTLCTERDMDEFR